MDRDIPPKELARRLNLTVDSSGSSLVHKWIHGARVPSAKSDYVREIASALSLSREEYKRLEKAWHYSLTVDWLTEIFGEQRAREIARYAWRRWAAILGFLVGPTRTWNPDAAGAKPSLDREAERGKEGRLVAPTVEVEITNRGNRRAVAAVSYSPLRPLGTEPYLPIPRALPPWAGILQEDLTLAAHGSVMTHLRPPVVSSGVYEVYIAADQSFEARMKVPTRTPTLTENRITTVRYAASSTESRLDIVALESPVLECRLPVNRRWILHSRDGRSASLPATIPYGETRCRFWYPHDSFFATTFPPLAYVQGQGYRFYEGEALKIDEIQGHAFTVLSTNQSGASRFGLTWPVADPGLIRGFVPGKHLGTDIVDGPKLSKVISSLYVPVMAAGHGVVVECGLDVAGDRSKGYGMRLVIQHDNGIRSLYGNLDDGEYRPLVTVGQRVERGDIVGHIGRTGDTNVEYLGDLAHLHFGLQVGGEYRKPREFLLADEQLFYYWNGDRMLCFRICRA